MANRGVFEDRYHQLSKHAFSDVSVAALALIELDHFKEIIDRLGHAAGDECLRQVAIRLQRAFWDAILVARIGGDEFAVLLRGPLPPLEIKQTLAHALRALCRPVIWRNLLIDVGTSIGAAILKRPYHKDSSQLFAEADSALYAAKAAGRKMVRIFGEDIDHRPRSSALYKVAGHSFQSK